LTKSKTGRHVWFWRDRLVPGSTPGRYDGLDENLHELVGRTIHFEAGGMVKGLGKGKVAAILLDMDYHELHQPLSFFNALRLNREGVWQLVKSFTREFNKESKNPIKDRVIERTFEKFWPELDRDYQTLFPEAHRRSQDAEPLHIVTPRPPEPSLLSGSNQEQKRKGKKSVRDADAERHQPGLFNGVKD
jgi:hypothetical protein